MLKRHSNPDSSATALPGEQPVTRRVSASKARCTSAATIAAPPVFAVTATLNSSKTCTQVLFYSNRPSPQHTSFPSSSRCDTRNPSDTQQTTSQMLVITLTPEAPRAGGTSTHVHACCRRSDPVSLMHQSHTGCTAR